MIEIVLNRLFGTPMIRNLLFVLNLSAVQMFTVDLQPQIIENRSFSSENDKVQNHLKSVVDRILVYFIF